MPESALKVIVQFAKREDGGIRAWSDDVPGLVLSSNNIEGLLDDIRSAIEVILGHQLGCKVSARPLRPAGEMGQNSQTDSCFFTKPTKREFVALCP